MSIFNNLRDFATKVLELTKTTENNVAQIKKLKQQVVILTRIVKELKHNLDLERQKNEAEKQRHQLEIKNLKLDLENRLQKYEIAILKLERSNSDENNRGISESSDNRSILGDSDLAQMN